MNSDIFKKLSDEYSNITSASHEEPLEEKTKLNNEEEIFQSDELIEENNNDSIIPDIINLIKHWENAADKDKIMTEWLTGERVRRAIYGIKDYETGHKVLEGIAEQTQVKLGSDFDLQFIQHCLKLSEAFPDMSILTETSEQISRDQLIAILKITDDQARLYFCELCKLKKWTLEQLQSYIDMGIDETQKLMEE